MVLWLVVDALGMVINKPKDVIAILLCTTNVHSATRNLATSTGTMVQLEVFSALTGILHNFSPPARFLHLD